ncbi:MAG: DUF4112 domain-containing protein [Pseudomonadota bacterium]
MKTGKEEPIVKRENATNGVSRRISTLSWLLDESIRLPGGYRVGWDGIVGLIPGLGDLIGLAASSYILYLAAQGGAGKIILARMACNILIETGVGSIPLIGDLFDFVFKANSRNLKLLQRHVAEPARARRVSGAWLSVFLLFILAAVAGIVTLMVELIRWLVAAAA